MSKKYSQLERLSKETLDIMAKATTAGINTSTGAYGIELLDYTSLVPVNAVARNNTAAFPRKIAKKGAPVAQWKTWLNVNSSQLSGNVGVDYAGSMTNFSEQDVYAAYKIVSKAGVVTWDAEAFGRGYVDNFANAELGVLGQLFIAQDMNICMSQGWALPAIGSVSLTASTTGGSLATGTVYVRVAPRSGANYYEGGSGPAGTEVSQAVTGPNGAVTATWAAVKGAVAYDVYVGSAAGAEYYYTTTTVATVSITTVPTSGTSNPIPTSTLPLISTLRPGTNVAPLAYPQVAGNGTPPTVDTSWNVNYYNGVLASSLGDYSSTGPVTPGSGTPTGAGFFDNGGAAPTGSGNSITILDEVNQYLFDTVQLSPTAYMMNSHQAKAISNLLTANGSAVTYLPPTDQDARSNLAGGGYIGRYINTSAGGVPVSIEIHPHVPPGTIIARTDHVNFPGSGIGSVFEVNCQYDSVRIDYAANYNPGVEYGGPRKNFEIRSNETLINRAPVAQVVISNIG